MNKPHVMRGLILKDWYGLRSYLVRQMGLVLAMYVVVWSGIVALFAVIVALGCGLIAGVAAMILYWAQFPMTGLFLLLRRA